MFMTTLFNDISAFQRSQHPAPGNAQGLVAHLMVLAHFVHRSTLERLSADGRYKKLSLTFEGYISLLAQRDYTPGELAEHLGVSKQTCSQTLRELDRLGLVSRRRNPRDSRSSIVSLSEQGLALLQDGITITGDIHRQFADQVGADKLEQLLRILEKLCAVLDIQTPTLNALGPAGGQRPTRLNVLLPALNGYFHNTLLAALTERGFAGLKSSFGQVLGVISRNGRTIQYIASVIGISKQAIAATAADLEQHGYIVRESDPDDKRQSILRLSPQGQKLLAASIACVRALETDIHRLLGDSDYTLLENVLATLYIQVADHYDAVSVLPAKIQQLSDYLLAELGVSGAQALAQQLMTLTRGKR